MTANGQGRAMDAPMIPPALGDIGMIELLECDSRPTFILDLDQTRYPDHDHLDTTFSNVALQRLSHILCPAQEGGDTVVDNDALERFWLFKDWATSSSTHDHTADACTTPFEYQNLFWIGSTLRKRWRIISGSAFGPDAPAGSHPGSPTGSQTENHSMGTKSRNIHPQKKNGRFQTCIHHTWTDDLPMSEHVQFFKSTDWSATALGPLETWSGCLRQMTRFLMSDSRAAIMFWYKPTA